MFNQEKYPNTFLHFFPLGFCQYCQNSNMRRKIANYSKEVIVIIKRCQKKTLNLKPSVPICTQSALAMYRNENLYGSFLIFLTFLHIHFN